MRIEDYPLATTIGDEDLLILETSEGTKKVKASTFSAGNTEMILNTFYPVGTLYLSMESTSPAEIFGGSWVQLNNVFLRAGNDTNTGGSDTVTLTTAQMPSHYHIINGLGKCSVQASGYGLTKAAAFTDNVMIAGGQTNTMNSGNTTAHENMPSYQNVYAWRRIS